MSDKQFYCFVSESGHGKVKCALPENVFCYVLDDAFYFGISHVHEVDGTSVMPSFKILPITDLVAVTSNHNRVMLWLMGKVDSHQLMCEHDCRNEPSLSVEGIL